MIISPVSQLGTVFFVFGSAPSIVFVSVIADFPFIAVKLNLIARLDSEQMRTHICAT